MTDTYNFTVDRVGHVIERRADKDWKFNGGSMKRFYLVMSLSGTGYYQVGDETYVINQHDFALVPPYTERICFTDENDPWHFISISFFIDDYAPIVEKMEYKPVIVRNVNRHIRDIFKNLVMEWSLKSKVHQTLCRAYVQSIMCYAVMVSESQNFNPLHYATIEKAKNYINENFDKNISVEELAQLSEMSTSHFRKIFREIVGMTATQYAINLRINKAKDLLASGTANVSEAAFASGFKDIFYFSAMFKKVTGENPSKYNK